MMERANPGQTPVVINCRRTFGPIIRVFCYLRISTNKEEQELSMESQLQGMEEYIQAHQNWVLVKVYADEGISGTSARNRKQFLEMIRDAKNGGCEKILVKSISRYSRNTLDLLRYVRELKEIGIGVCFIKENIDTSDIHGEMMLTVLSAFAQNESLSISENVKWGIRKRYEMGIIRWTKLYGYRRDENKNIVIDEDEAEVVRYIFDQYREGANIGTLANALNENEIPSPRGSQWLKATIAGTLKNERYIGNTWQQRWYVPDFLTHKSVLNDGSQYPVYHIENSHEGIVSKKVFYQVQRILELKNPRGEYSRYPYADTKIICPFCGKSMITRQMNTKVDSKAICCFEEGGCQRFSVKARLLDESLRTAFGYLNANDISGQGNAAKDMRERLEKGIPASIEYAFLADTVKRITFIPYPKTIIRNHKKRPATEESVYDWEVKIDWRCGISSSAPMLLNKRYSDEPTRVAMFYKKHLDRLLSGNTCPRYTRGIADRKMVEGKRTISYGACLRQNPEVTT